MGVYCWNENCKYNSHGCCQSNDIVIGEENDCETFVDYHEEAEWKTPFWKRMVDRETEETARVKFYGKEIEVHGRTFFVESKSGYASVTDKETGLLCGEFCKLDEKRVETINEKAKLWGSVETLPIARRDSKTGKLTFESEGEERSEP